MVTDGRHGLCWIWNAYESGVKLFHYWCYDTVKIFPLYCIGPMSMMDLVQLKVPIPEHQEIYIENVIPGKKKLE